eukprot:88236-Amorphochlora_amoeboformis.AAC.2
MAPVKLRSDISRALRDYHQQMCRLVSGKPTRTPGVGSARSPVAARRYLERLKDKPERPTLVSQFLSLKDALALPLNLASNDLIQAHRLTFSSIVARLSNDTFDVIARQRKFERELADPSRVEGFSLLYHMISGGHWVVKTSKNLGEISTHVKKYVSMQEEKTKFSVIQHRAKDCPVKRFLNDKSWYVKN